MKPTKALPEQGFKYFSKQVTCREQSFHDLWMEGYEAKQETAVFIH